MSFIFAMVDPHSRKERQIRQSTTRPPWLRRSHRSRPIPAPHARLSSPTRRSDPAQPCRQWALASWPPQERRRMASQQRDHPQDLPDPALDAAAPRRSMQFKPRCKPLWPSTQPAPWGLCEDHPADGSKAGSQGRRSKPLGPTTTVSQTRAARSRSE